MKRRDFIRKGLTLSGATLLSPSVRSACNNGSSPLQSTSRIVIAHDEQVRTSTRSVDSDRVLKMLDNGLQALYDRDHPLEAWEKVVRQGEVVGLKVNCLSGRGSTHTELVEAICERLQGVGIKAGNIIIWDRFTSDLEDGGFRPMDQGDEVRCFGNDRFGFESDLAEGYKSRAAVLLEKEHLLAALEAAKKARDLRPDWDEPYVQLGDIYKERGEARLALKMYEHALTIRPSVRALCGKGDILNMRGEIDSALVSLASLLALRRAVVIDSKWNL